MKLHLFRRMLPQLALSFATAVVVAACGGGGASQNPNQGGAVSLLPATGTVYAGVPFTFTVSGGLRPYSLTSSEPGILSVPQSINSFSFDVVAANPGVVDTGLQPGDLPVRTVNVTARDATGGVATSVVKVAQNFLTGYGLSFSSNCPTPTGATTTPDACAGGDTIVNLLAVSNGALHGNEAFRSDVVSGNFQFNTPGGRANSVTVVSDHNGAASASFHVPSGVPSQVAVLRVTEVATGVTTDRAFVISQQGPSGTLTAVPSTITFTGNLTTDCGVGSSDFLVFDGVAPYTATSSNPRIGVAPAQSSTNPGRFTVTVGGTAPPCATGTVIVQDGTGSRTTVTVTSAPGAGATPTPATFDVQPTALTLACGTSGSATAVGGSGSYTATSSHPRITAVVAGHTITITRLAGDGATNYPDNGTVTVSDGSSAANIAVTVSPPGTTNCP